MDDLTARRLNWIRDLESGEKDQTTGVLCRVFSPDETGYCCLGVARDVADPGHFNSNPANRWMLSFNDEDDYFTVQVTYELSGKLKDHLVAMNDGDSILIDGEYRRAPGIRHRDFKFIARFLRKVWGLTDAE